MRTTCPECRTTFRVAQAQLSARRGLVRCGHCQAVFNAYDTLLPDLEEPPVDKPIMAAGASAEPPRGPSDEAPSGVAPLSPGTAETVPESAVPGGQGTGAAAAAEPSGFMMPVSADTDPASARPPAKRQAAEARPIPPASAAPARAGMAGQESFQESSESILLTPLPRHLPQPASARPRWQAVLLALAGLLLLATLLAQLAYFLRAQLVSVWPASRPALTWLCEPLGCQVPLPRQLDKHALVASALEHDPERKSRVRLTFLLANRTDQTQAWPHVVLLLSDAREAPVGRQFFEPSAYLPDDVDPAAGFAAGAEREVRLDLDIGSLAASGYALELVYP